MATNIASATTTTFAGAGPGPVLVKVTGTWGGTSLAIKVQNGNSEWETYPTDGTQTANFAKVYTLAKEDGGEKGIQLITTGGSGIDLWAQVSE